MVGLIDIAPASERVHIRGVDVDVTGVSASGVAALFGRFPDIRKVIMGREVELDDMMALGGELIAAILAAGTGALGNPEAEKIADSLSVDEQADLMLAIIRVTLPKGVENFVSKLTGAGGALGVSDLGLAPAAEPATNSRKRSKS